MRPVSFPRPPPQQRRGLTGTGLGRASGSAPPPPHSPVSHRLRLPRRAGGGGRGGAGLSPYGLVRPGVPVRRERARRQRRPALPPGPQGYRRRRSSGVGPSSSASLRARKGCGLCGQPPWQAARRRCARQGRLSRLRGAVGWRMHMALEERSESVALPLLS